MVSYCWSAPDPFELTNLFYDVASNTDSGRPTHQSKTTFVLSKDTIYIYQLYTSYTYTSSLINSSNLYFLFILNLMLAFL